MKTGLSLLQKQLIVLSALIMVFAGGEVALAKPVTVTREYTYRASEADSKLTSRTIALEQVKRMLLEELGTYLVSNTEVRDSALTKDEIVTYTSGWVATVVVKEVWNGEDYYLKAKITADADEVAKAVALMHEDRETSSELKRLRAQNSDALKEVKRLRKELAGLKSSAKSGSPAKVASAQKDYDLAVARLAANEGIETAFDGRWAVSLICEDVHKNGFLVKGYTLNFYADVKDGRLMGKLGQSGQPASMTMIGILHKDGVAQINVQGLTGKSEYTIMHVQPGKLYSYRMHGTFTQDNGRASRIELRPCEAVFIKQ